MDFFGSKIFWFSLRLIQLLVTILILGLSSYVIEWFQETWSITSPTPLSFLLFSSILTPLSLIYLLFVPVHCSNSRWSSAGLVAFVEGSMALLWAASSIATAVYVTERICFGKVCQVAQGAVVLGVFEWLAFMVSFGFSLAFTIRDARDAYPVIETGKGGEFR